VLAPWSASALGNEVALAVLADVGIDAGGGNIGVAQNEFEDTRGLAAA